jgi:hypothetical protein
MKVKELKAILKDEDTRYDDEEVSVLLDLPSFGPRAFSKVKHASFGMDWDKGLQFKTEHNLVPKNDKQAIYEQARDLLFYIATKPTKKHGYEQRTAIYILKKNGLTDDKLASYQSIFHNIKAPTDKQGERV